MNLQSNPPPAKSLTRRLSGIALVLIVSSLLVSCGRPSDAEISSQLSKIYACKDMEMVEMVKSDSLPGIYSYVAQYTVLFRFKEGEAGALKFYKGLFEKMEVKDNNWEEALKADKVQDYIGDECTDNASMAVERMIEAVLPQMAEKKAEIRLPHTLPIAG